MADIIQHPAAKGDAEQTLAATPHWVGDPELEAEAQALVAMLKDEIGVKWMSFGLRLQIEKIEILIGER
jgi:hypothetical protein